VAAVEVSSSSSSSRLSRDSTGARRLPPAARLHGNDGKYSAALRCSRWDSMPKCTRA